MHRGGDCESDAYQTIVDVVAENPGLNTDGLADLAGDHGIDDARVSHLLLEALEAGDVIEADSKYWVVRVGQYAFGEYEHPEP